MDDDRQCQCLHTYSEHRFDQGTNSGGHECEVSGCDCICFELDEDEEDGEE